MKFNLLESNAKKLVKLAYLGFYILNREELYKSLNEYEPLIEWLIKEYVKNTKKMKLRLQGLKREIASKELHKEVGECMDELYENAYETVEGLEKGALPFALSQALADLEYPDTSDGDNLIKNVLTQEFYEEEITKAGAKIVRLDLPGGEERLKKLLSEAQEDKSCVV